MSCCFPSKNTPVKIEYSQEQVDRYKRHSRDAKITVFALGMIALFLFAVACVLFGMGTLPATDLMGLGMFPYLGGAFLGFLSIGILSGSLIFGLIAAVRSYQKERWQNQPSELLLV